MVAKLSKEGFKNKIAEAKEKAKQGFNDFEMGQYTFKLGSYAVKEGDEMVIGKWVCTSEEEKGKEFVKFFNIEKALGILLSEWRDLGYDTDKMEESYKGLIDWCKMITKESPSVQATIYMKKGYPTMKIDELIEEDEGSGADPEPEVKETAKAVAAKSAPVAAAKAKTVAKPEAVEEVADVEDVSEVSEVEEEAEVEVGTKIVFTWKGADKEGEISEIIDEENFKVLADNGGKKGKFPVKAEMIKKVIGK